MAKYNFENQYKLQDKLAQIYETAPDTLKNSVSVQDFVNSFPIIEQNGRGVEPDKPEDFEIDDNIFDQVIKAFREVYR
ncbi:hypothetical protein ACFSC6_00075 [Rufibacter sediminis]|uniref:hypothetical protein n=1 Tax=Rufibacter sediminis TaxID=2762756 RepID=UPI00210A789E|nr:hypothetical protein [Rufibacter sediminis]